MVNLISSKGVSPCLCFANGFNKSPKTSRIWPMQVVVEYLIGEVI